VAAEISLKNAPILRAIEHSAPRFELAHTCGSFLRVDLRHSPVIHVLAAAHRVGKVHSPIVAVVNVRECGGNATFRHHRVSFAEQRFADESDSRSRLSRFDRCS
jgi:hypothetical protein